MRALLLPVAVIRRSELFFESFSNLLSHRVIAREFSDAFFSLDYLDTQTDFITLFCTLLLNIFKPPMVNLFGDTQKCYYFGCES